jgi:hypothetical protein
VTKYLLAFFAEGGDEEVAAERLAELPEWDELLRELRKQSAWITNAALQPDSATTVRVRDGEVAITDGPHAVTRETLAGFFLLDCADLDEVLRYAARVPLARYGSVEVWPVAEL